MRRTLLSICAVVMAVGLGGSAQQPQSPTERRQTDEQQTAAGEDRTDYTSALNGIAGAIERAAPAPEGADAEQRAKDDVKAQKDMAFWALVVAFGTLAQFVVGACGTIFLIQTLNLTKRGLDQTREANVHQLRAYLGIYAFKAVQNEGRVALSFQVDNRGQTPARRLRTRWEIAFGPPVPVTDDFKFPFQHPGVKVGVMVPGGEQFIGPHLLSKDRTAQLIAGTLSCHIYGSVDYDDAFDGTPRRRLEFCAAVEAEKNPLTGETQFRFQMVDRHNNMDEDCERPPEPWRAGLTDDGLGPVHDDI